MLTNTRVLMIEDNKELQGVIADFLNFKGYDFDFADDGSQGVKLALEGDFDIIILDVMLPKMNGIEVATMLRKQHCETPILMLTALDEKQTLLAGFNSGVDDFVTKPFDFDELEARLSSLTKRNRKKAALRKVSFGEITVDLSKHLAYRKGVALNLMPVTFQILTTLVKAAPNIVSRDELIHELWGHDVPANDVLRCHIYNLRNVLDKPFKQPLLVTVPSAGFRLEK